MLLHCIQDRALSQLASDCWNPCLRGCMNYLLAIKRAEDKCRGRFIVPIASAKRSGARINTSALILHLLTRRDIPLEPTTGGR